MTRSGEVWTWGKGDYYRLGHGSDQHVRKPSPVQGLRGKKVVHVAVGALHCLAVTEAGQVYGWGKKLLLQSEISLNLLKIH